MGKPPCQLKETGSFKSNESYRYKLGGGCIFFHPYLGKIPILTNIFQRG